MLNIYSAKNIDYIYIFFYRFKCTVRKRWRECVPISRQI